MSIVKLESAKFGQNLSNPPSILRAAFALGFRPFFIGASAYSVISISFWFVFYVLNIKILPATLPPTLWHAHEMVFGYAMAVVAGFLLTAVGNWTGEEMPSGVKLGFLFLLWLSARVLYAVDLPSVYPAVFMELMFHLILIVFVIRPILRQKQWKQIAIVAKLVFLGLAAALFSFGIINQDFVLMRQGIYLGLYFLLGLILTLGRRIIPRFIESGVGYPVSLQNFRMIDLGSLVGFLSFVVLAVFTQMVSLTAYLSGALAVLYSVRLYCWYTPGIWKKPLLWSLYLSYSSLVLGFLLYFLTNFGIGNTFLAIHAFTFGGIGLVTLGMMARVTLGHTGRSIHQPPRAIAVALAILSVGALIRVIFPLFASEHYVLWVALSQIAWVLAFTIFLVTFGPMLLSARVDGKPG